MYFSIRNVYFYFEMCVWLPLILKKKNTFLRAFCHSYIFTIQIFFEIMLGINGTRESGQDVREENGKSSVALLLW